MSEEKCQECLGIGSVAVTTGYGGDGNMPCPKCYPEFSGIYQVEPDDDRFLIYGPGFEKYEKPDLSTTEKRKQFIERILNIAFSQGRASRDGLRRTLETVLSIRNGELRNKEVSNAAWAILDSMFEIVKNQLESDTLDAEREVEK